jgi:2-keto-3-deoxy-L-rhamnonate aldolase RhmA
MELTPNAFKRALEARKKLVGLWSQPGSATVVELLADARPDWVLIDTEHAGDIGGVLINCACWTGGVSALVRVRSGTIPAVQTLLDAGGTPGPTLRRQRKQRRRGGDPLIHHTV